MTTDTTRRLFTVDGRQKPLEEFTKQELIDLIRWMEADRVRTTANVLQRVEPIA